MVLNELYQVADFTNEYGMLFNDDCLSRMKDIPDNSIDCIICDLPYGTTKLEWDSIIDFELLWKEYNRVLKDDTNIVLFSSGNFTYNLNEVKGIYGGCFDCEDCEDGDMHCEECTVFEKESH